LEIIGEAAKKIDEEFKDVGCWKSSEHTELPFGYYGDWAIIFQNGFLGNIGIKNGF